MNYEKIQAIILAAGKSTRFNTSNTKLSFTICGQEMITYPAMLFKELNIKTKFVLGYQKELIINILKKYIDNVEYIDQEKQDGTGQAICKAMPYLYAEDIIVLNGDMPLINKNIINSLIEEHYKSKSQITFAIAEDKDSEFLQYAKVLIQDNKYQIIEPRDFNKNLRASINTNIINAGIYIFKKEFLEKEINNLFYHENTNEKYITDLINIASLKNYNIRTVKVDFDYIRGVNNLKELWLVEQIKKSDIISNFMDKGIRFIAPQTIDIDTTVDIEPDVVIGQSVQLYGHTKIYNNSIINSFSTLQNSIIEDNVIIRQHSIIYDSIIKSGAQIGPFAHVKKQSVICEKSIVGNFVEISDSTIGSRTKAKHLAYLGNAKVGSNVNIGAGVITCNYNGTSKHTTIIENEAFIGTNSSLVAPLKIGSQAIVAAGSTINKNVPENALAISRPIQINKEEYALKLKDKYKNSVNYSSCHRYNNHEIQE